MLLATGGAERAAGRRGEDPQGARGAARDRRPVDGHDGVSIGIARFPEHGEDADALLRAADVAMYAAKRTKSRYAIYDPSHDERRQEFLTLLGELRHAVDADELVLHYQPKMSLAEDRVTSVEALVRWRHPQRGLVPPVDFIPFAEQTGYIRAITRWVLRARDRAVRRSGSAPACASACA